MNYGVRSSVREMTNLLVMFVVICLVLMRCGTAEQTPSEGKGNPDGSYQETPHTGTAASTSIAPAGIAQPSPTCSAMEGTGDNCNLMGGLDSAFALTVDGKPYSDIEEFYSAEIAALEQTAKDKGYQGYTTNFSAQLGLSDLKFGETVFVQAQGGTGFTGSTQIQNDGRFQISVDPGVTYDIRANKRISLLLTSPTGASVQWCWNFSATGSGKPGKDAILSLYSTALTLYACTTSEQGMTLPENPNTSTVTGTSTDTGAVH